MRGRRFVLIALVVAIVMVVGVAAFAAGSGLATHTRTRAAGQVQPLTTGATAGTGGGCKMGDDTETNVLTPPDDSTADNTPAASVTLTKACGGAVLGEFTSEVDTSSAGSLLHIDMRATCVGTGGFTTHCTIGTQVFASPGHTFMRNTNGGIETHEVNEVWTGLGKGQWTFEVLPGGNGTAYVDFRTFIVEAFAGG